MDVSLIIPIVQRHVGLQNQVTHMAQYQLRPLIIACSCLDIGVSLPCMCPPEMDPRSTADFSKPEMIESFNVPRNNVPKWAGIASAAFSLSQAATGIFWGRASDRWGRKATILVGVLWAMFSSLLFGFSTSLGSAILARSLAGMASGNVGTYRTVVAEIVPEKELQPRAFTVMPMVFTMGSIFGPGIGGALANPAKNYPKTFGKIAFFKIYPYALPNMAISVFFTVGLITGTLFLKVRCFVARTRPTILTLLRNRWNPRNTNGIMVESWVKA